VLPIFGPNTVRDGFGDIVDMFFQPLTYLVGPTQNLVIGATGGFSTLNAYDSALKALEESSIDYYAALRSAYLQNRAAHIRMREE
jgi:phospholipid-binding lipoprotein MlaA